MTPEQIRAYNAFANSYQKVFYHFVRTGNILQNSKNNHIQKSKNLLRAFNKPLAQRRTPFSPSNIHHYTGARNENARNVQSAENLFRKIRSKIRGSLALSRIQANAGGTTMHIPPGVIKHIMNST